MPRCFHIDPSPPISGWKWAVCERAPRDPLSYRQEHIASTCRIDLTAVESSVIAASGVDHDQESSYDDMIVARTVFVSTVWPAAGVSECELKQQLNNQLSQPAYQRQSTAEFRSRSRRWGLTQFSAEKAFLYANASCRRKWV